jgi:hypothetical protein
VIEIPPRAFCLSVTCLAKASREHLLCAELEPRRQDRLFGVDRSGAKLLEHVRVGAEADRRRVAKPGCHLNHVEPGLDHQARVGVAEVVDPGLWVELGYNDRALEDSPAPPAIAPVIPQAAVGRREDEG